MERPPTASSAGRPKTSSGRAPSARARPPPQPAGNGSVSTGIQRPPSRLTMSRQGGAPPPAPAPLALQQQPPPPSAMGGARPPSQMMRAPPTSSGRPTTGMARPPSSGLRPATQQGLRAPGSRMGTAGTRQVFDKSYFMGVLRAKISSLNVEIARMREKKERGERDRNELHAYEARAQAQALEIRDLQGKLVDLNVLLDRMHMNGDMSDIEIEAGKMKEKKEQLRVEVDEMFRARQEKEDEAQALQTEVDEQKKLNEAITSAMDPSEKERFLNLKAESLILIGKVVEMEKEIETMDEQIAKYQIELDSNPMKKKAMALQETIDELKKTEKQLLDDKNSKETPEQKKEKLIESMKQLNVDIGVIDKQFEQVKEQVSQASEELHEYESMDDSQHVKHHAQYLDLLAKDHQMEDLFQNYPKQIPLLQQELEEYASAIVLNLRKISANLRKVNIGDQINDMDEQGLDLNTGNVAELKEMHVRLQNELISLEDMEMAINQEIDQLTEQGQQVQQELQELRKVADIDDETYVRDLEDRRDHLEQQIPLMEAEHDELQTKYDAIQIEMEDPKNSAKIQKIRAIRDIKERMKMKSSEMKMSRDSLDLTPVKEDVRRLRQEFNQILIDNAGKRFL